MNFRQREREQVKTKIAILGGSFNPIHLGHIAIAKAAHLLVGADILIMPNSKTYYKQNHNAVTDEMRCDMIKLAIKDYPYMKLSTMEIDRGGETHTIDTINEIEASFKEKSEEAEIYFIIGGDSLAYLDKWIAAEELFKKTIFLTAVRDDVDCEKTMLLIEKYKRLYGARIEMLQTDNYAISSTAIRKMAAEKSCLTAFVPEAVAEYIELHGIYD